MDGMGLVYQEEEKLIDTGFNVIMPGLSGHISSFLFFFFLFTFERHFITFHRTSCQNYGYKQESRCINNTTAGLDFPAFQSLSNSDLRSGADMGQVQSPDTKGELCLS